MWPDPVLTHRAHMKLSLGSVSLTGRSRAGSLLSTRFNWHKPWLKSSDLSWRQAILCSMCRIGTQSCPSSSLGQIHLVVLRMEVDYQAQPFTWSHNGTTNWHLYAPDGSKGSVIADSASKSQLRCYQVARNHLSLKVSSCLTLMTCSRYWIVHPGTSSWTFHQVNRFGWSCGIVWHHFYRTLTLTFFSNCRKGYIWESISL